MEPNHHEIVPYLDIRIQTVIAMFVVSAQFPPLSCVLTPILSRLSSMSSRGRSRDTFLLLLVLELQLLNPSCSFTTLMTLSDWCSHYGILLWLRTMTICLHCSWQVVVFRLVFLALLIFSGVCKIKVLCNHAKDSEAG